MSSNTRYDVGDTVTHQNHSEMTGTVEDIYNPESDSPDYLIDWGSGTGHGETEKASDLEKFSPDAVPGAVNASDSEEVRKATNKLQRKFEKFEEENESFHFDEVVVDSKGFEVNILVDFGVEDYEEGAYYMGNVMATRSEQPTSDTEAIATSEAFYEAQSIVENAATGGLTDFSRYDAQWDNHGQDSGEHVDSSLAIVYNKENL